MRKAETYMLSNQPDTLPGAASLAVDFSPVAYSNNGDSIFTVANAIQDSVIANPEPIFLSGTKFLCACGPGIVFQRKNFVSEATMDRSG